MANCIAIKYNAYSFHAKKVTSACYGKSIKCNTSLLPNV